MGLSEKEFETFILNFLENVLIIGTNSASFMSAAISLGIRTGSRTSSNTCVKWGMRYSFVFPGHMVG